MKIFFGYLSIIVLCNSLDSNKFQLDRNRFVGNLEEQKDHLFFRSVIKARLKNHTERHNRESYSIFLPHRPRIVSFLKQDSIKEIILHKIDPNIKLDSDILKSSHFDVPTTINEVPFKKDVESQMVKIPILTNSMETKSVQELHDTVHVSKRVNHSLLKMNISLNISLNNPGKDSNISVQQLRVVDPSTRLQLHLVDDSKPLIQHGNESSDQKLMETKRVSAVVNNNSNVTNEVEVVKVFLPVIEQSNQTKLIDFKINISFSPKLMIDGKKAKVPRSQLKNQSEVIAVNRVIQSNVVKNFSSEGLKEDSSMNSRRKLQKSNVSSLVGDRFNKSLLSKNGSMESDATPVVFKSSQGREKSAVKSSYTAPTQDQTLSISATDMNLQHVVHNIENVIKKVFFDEVIGTQRDSEVFSKKNKSVHKNNHNMLTPHDSKLLLSKNNTEPNNTMFTPHDSKLLPSKNNTEPNNTMLTPHDSKLLLSENNTEPNIKSVYKNNHTIVSSEDSKIFNINEVQKMAKSNHKNNRTMAIRGQKIEISVQKSNHIVKIPQDAKLFKTNKEQKKENSLQKKGHVMVSPGELKVFVKVNKERNMIKSFHKNDHTVIAQQGSKTFSNKINEENIKTIHKNEHTVVTPKDSKAFVKMNKADNINKSPHKNDRGVATPLTSKAFLNMTKLVHKSNHTKASLQGSVVSVKINEDQNMGKVVHKNNHSAVTSLSLKVVVKINKEQKNMKSVKNNSMAILQDSKVSVKINKDQKNIKKLVHKKNHSMAISQDSKVFVKINKDQKNIKKLVHKKNHSRITSQDLKGFVNVNSENNMKLVHKNNHSMVTSQDSKLFVKVSEEHGMEKSFNQVNKMQNVKKLVQKNGHIIVTPQNSKVFVENKGEVQNTRKSVHKNNPKTIIFDPSVSKKLRQKEKEVLDVLNQEVASFDLFAHKKVNKLKANGKALLKKIAANEIATNEIAEKKRPKVTKKEEPFLSNVGGLDFAQAIRDFEKKKNNQKKIIHMEDKRENLLGKFGIHEIIKKKQKTVKKRPSNKVSSPSLTEAIRSFRESAIDLQTALEPESYASMNRQHPAVYTTPKKEEAELSEADLKGDSITKDDGPNIPVHPMAKLRLHAIMKDGPSKNGVSGLTNVFFNVFVLVLVQLALNEH